MNNSNYLPNDIMSHILSIRREEMKKDKYKKDYNKFVNDFKESIYNFKDDTLRDRIGYENLYNKHTYMDWSDCKNILDTYELWEISSRILTPTEEEEKINILNWYIFPN